MYKNLMIGDEVIIHEIQGQKKTKVYDARIEGIYEHFINVRHKNGYLISILKQDLGKKVLIRVRGNGKMAEKLTKEVLAEELKTMSLEEIAQKHGIKRVGVVKAMAVRSGLIEGTGVYAKKKLEREKQKQEKQEEIKMEITNLLKPTSFIGESGKRYEIREGHITIYDAVSRQAILIEKEKFEMFSNEVSALLKYVKEEVKGKRVVNEGHEDIHNF